MNAQLNWALRLFYLFIEKFIFIIHRPIELGDKALS
jgi:hypothetical protein